MSKIVNYFFLAVGIIMVSFGLWLIFNPRTTLSIVVVLMGIVLLLNGISEIISYVSERKKWSISVWYLFDGLLSTTFGLLVLFNGQVGKNFLILLFAIWILASAIFRILLAFSVKSVSNWFIILIVGVLGLIVGIVSLFNSIFVSVALAVVLGGFFIFQGVTCIFISSFLRRNH